MMRRIALTALAMMMAMLTGCGKTADSTGDKQRNEDYRYSAGFGMQKVTYQPQGVSFQKYGLIYYSEWEDDAMDVICDDPACEHNTSACGAKVSNFGISLVHNNRRIIIDPEDAECEIINDTDRIIYGKMALMEADMNGSNRKKVLTFDMNLPIVSGIVYDDRLYVAGIQSTYEHQVYNGLVYDESIGDYVPQYTCEQTYSEAVLCIDLNTYEVTEVFRADDVVHAHNFMFCADEKAAYVYMCSLLSFDEESFEGEYCFALYQIDGENLTKVTEQTTKNINWYICGMDDGRLLFIYNHSQGKELGELDGMFCVNNGQIEKLEGKSICSSLLDGRTYAVKTEDDRYIVEFYELEADTLIETIEYPQQLSYIGLYWGKLVYWLPGSGSGKYYFADIKDLKKLGKNDKLWFWEFDPVYDVQRN